MLILRSSYLEANLPELLAKFGFLFLLPPWPIPSADLPAGGSGEDTHEKFHPFFPRSLTLRWWPVAQFLTPPWGRVTPGFASGTPLPAPGGREAK